MFGKIKKPCSGRHVCDPVALVQCRVQHLGLKMSHEFCYSNPVSHAFVIAKRLNLRFRTLNSKRSRNTAPSDTLEADSSGTQCVTQILKHFLAGNASTKVSFSRKRQHFTRSKQNRPERTGCWKFSSYCLLKPIVFRTRVSNLRHQPASPKNAEQMKSRRAQELSGLFELVN